MAPFFVQGNNFLPWKDAGPAQEARALCFNSAEWASEKAELTTDTQPALDPGSTGCRGPSRAGAPAWSTDSSFPQLANSSSIFTSQAKLHSFPTGFTNPLQSRAPLRDSLEPRGPARSSFLPQFTPALLYVAVGLISVPLGRLDALRGQGTRLFCS